MKTTISKLLLVVYLFPFPALAQSNVDDRIKRVERGLLPAVLIKGDSSWSIEERMKHWKMPGLSIAVVKDFRVEWARSYGNNQISPLSRKKGIMPLTHQSLISHIMSPEEIAIIALVCGAIQALDVIYRYSASRGMDAR